MYTYTISAPSQPSVPPTTHQHPYPSLQPTQYLYNLHLTHLNPTSPSPFLCLLSCPIRSSPSLISNYSTFPESCYSTRWASLPLLIAELHHSLTPVSCVYIYTYTYPRTHLTHPARSVSYRMNKRTNKPREREKKEREGIRTTSHHPLYSSRVK